MASRQRSGYNYEDYVPLDGIRCPICDCSCTSLEALNSHLDSAHTEEDSKGALLLWFRNAQKKVQSSFGSTSPRTTLSGSPTNTGSGFLGGTAVERSLKQLVDPTLISSFSNLSIGNSNAAYFASDANDKQLQGEVVTREHWQRESGQDICSSPGCGKALGRLGVGKRHCSQCGKLFCEQHTQYEIKLDSSARHDPENGVWCRVCFGCFVSRPGYMDHQGATRNLTDVFLKKRAKTIDRVHLESNRLEKRLEKLARIHYYIDTGNKHEVNHSSSTPSLGSLSMGLSESSSSRDSIASSVMSPKSGYVSNGNSILSMKLKYRDGEQSVAKWDDDRNVKNCPLCGNVFTMTNRKHHCRLCGRVICGSTRCSNMIPLFLNMSSDYFDEQPVGDTRACRDCQRAVFRRKIKHEEAMRPLPIMQLYHQLSLARQNIEKQLPRFHEMILMLEKEKITSQTEQSFQKAAVIRKSLLDNFALYDTLAKSIKSLPVQSNSMKRLQANVCTAANLYLQQNMLPLQMLPRILKPDKKSNGGSKLKSASNGKASGGNPELAVQLQAFQEQQALLEGYIREAQRNRKFEDVRTLKRNLDELLAEMARLKAEQTY